MVESYYRPAAGQGRVETGGLTWNRPDYFTSDLGALGRWAIVQKYDSGYNRLYIRVSLLSYATGPLVPELPEAVFSSSGETHVVVLAERKFNDAPNLAWSGEAEIYFGKKKVREFTLAVPAVMAGAQRMELKPFRFKRGMGPVFYKILQ